MSEHDQDSKELEQVQLEAAWRRHVVACDRPIASCAPCAAWFDLERCS